MTGPIQRGRVRRLRGDAGSVMATLSDLLAEDERIADGGRWRARPPGPGPMRPQAPTVVVRMARRPPGPLA